MRFNERLWSRRDVLDGGTKVALGVALGKLAESVGASPEQNGGLFPGECEPGDLEVDSTHPLRTAENRHKSLEGLHPTELAFDLEETWAALSLIRYQIPEGVDVQIMGQRPYEAGSENLERQYPTAMIINKGTAERDGGSINFQELFPCPGDPAGSEPFNDWAQTVEIRRTEGFVEAISGAGDEGLTVELWGFIDDEGNDGANPADADEHLRVTLRGRMPEPQETASPPAPTQTVIDPEPTATPRQPTASPTPGAYPINTPSPAGDYHSYLPGVLRLGE